MAWQWHHAPGLETMCVTNAELGFFQALPGCPWEVTEPTPPGQVPCAFMAMIGELEMPVRYFMMRRPPHAMDPALLAPLLARTWAQGRAAELGETRPAPAEQLARFGVEGAGSIQYTLKAGVGERVDTEETLALVRGDSVLFIVKSFAKAKMNPISWALFNSASTQSISWRGPGQPLPPVASVWPASVFLEPGVQGQAKPEARNRLQAALHGSEAGSADEGALAKALTALFGGSEPLAQPVTADMKKTYADYLKASCDNRVLWGAIDHGLTMVENAYDLHGFAIVLWREIE
jgi:hypothetical protein